jgi:DNA-binding transcriptional MerR regulator
MSRSKKPDEVDLPLFSPRMETSLPNDAPRDKMMSSAPAATTNEETRYYRIGEVSRLTALKPFVLRYWETEFPMLEPVKSPSGHRLYRQQDVDLVLKIKRLLYDEGYTIAGARRHLKEAGGDSGESGAPGISSGEGTTTQLSRKMLLDLRDGLRSFLTLLERK